MKLQHTVAVVLLALLGSGPIRARDWGFSTRSRIVCLSDGAPGRPIELPSPDRRRKIVLESADDHWKWWGVQNRTHRLELPISDWPCPEFSWSPDSKAFFVTYSDGGSIGNWYVLVYALDGDDLQRLDATTLVRRDFLSHYPKCFDPEEPNIGAIDWLGSSRRLLLAAEVLPHSNCDNMGTFAAYAVALPGGHIVRKYNQLEAKRLFADRLGAKLRRAPDECFRKPGSCFIPMLHPK